MSQQGRPGSNQHQDPALRLAALKLDLAQTRAQFPSDENFEAVLEAQNEAQRAQREATRTRINDLEDQIDKILTEQE